MPDFPQSKNVYHARIDSAGRVVIPSESRQRLGMHQGDTVVIHVDDQGLHITTLEQSLKKAQALFARIKQPGESIVDELLRERREEAARE